MGNRQSKKTYKKSKNKKKILMNRSSLSQETFNFDLVLKKLDKISLDDTSIDELDLHEANFKTIINELKVLNSSCIAINNYGLTNFNETLANALCTTCFSAEQQTKLIKLIIYNIDIDISIDDLFLSCMEAYSIEVSRLVLDKLIAKINNYATVHYYSNAISKKYAFANTPLVNTIADVFLNKFLTFLNTLKLNEELIDIENYLTNIYNFQNIINSLFECGFKIENVKLLSNYNRDANFHMYLIYVDFDLNDLFSDQAKKNDAIKLIDTNIKNIIDNLDRLVYNSRINKLFKLIKYEEKDFDLFKSRLKDILYEKLKSSPNDFIRNIADLNLTKLSKNKFQPMRLDNSCRITINRMFHRNILLKNRYRSLDYLPAQLISYLNYDKEKYDNIPFYFL